MAGEQKTRVVLYDDARDIFMKSIYGLNSCYQEMGWAVPLIESELECLIDEYNNDHYIYLSLNKHGISIAIWEHVKKMKLVNAQFLRQASRIDFTRTSRVLQHSLEEWQKNEAMRIAGDLFEETIAQANAHYEEYLENEVEQENRSSFQDLVERWDAIPIWDYINWDEPNAYYQAQKRRDDKWESLKNDLVALEEEIEKMEWLEREKQIEEQEQWAQEMRDRYDSN